MTLLSLSNTFHRYLWQYSLLSLGLWIPRVVSFLAGEHQIPLNSPYSTRYLRYASFGDSWASGISYGPPNPALEYDFAVFEEVCRCRRINDAYPVLLRDEPLRVWSGGRIPEVDFQACHGAGFGDVNGQVKRLNQSVTPEMATLMVGGNNAGFPEMIENCIFQFNKDRNYGPEYPDAEGECAKALARANERVRAGWFKKGLKDSIDAILNEPRINKQKGFKLYVLGYAGMFNHDDTACNNQSFGVIPGKQPKLSRELRRAFNELIDIGREVYDGYINRERRDPRVRFVDVNPAFAGHRFCEHTDDGSMKGQVDNSWLWALSWPDCIPLSTMAGVGGWEGVVGGRDGGGGERRDVDVSGGFCRKCGDWRQLGEVQRPFHPKREGHVAIKDLLLEVLMGDLGV